MTTNLPATTATALCIVLTTACLSGQAMSTAAGTGIAHDAEPEIFLAAVSYLPALTGGLELRVDPRPLAPDADLMSAQAENVVGSGEPERAAILRHLGVPRVDMFDAGMCSGLGGTPPPGVLPRTQGSHACAMLALSRAGGVHYPRENIDERDRVGAATHRAVRVAMISPGRFSTIELVLRLEGASWRVVERRVLVEVVS